MKELAIIMLIVVGISLGPLAVLQCNEDRDFDKWERCVNATKDVEKCKEFK